MTDQGQLHENPRFGRVPDKLMHDLNLTDGAVRLYAHMVWRYGRNRKNFEGRKSMSDFMGVSQATITKRIQELEAADWVVTIERDYDPKTGNYQTHFYHVFLSQKQAQEFRKEFKPAENSAIREKPAVEARKLRKGVGGKPAHKPTDHVNSSLQGSHVNLSLRGHVNLSLLHLRNSSLLNLYAWYLYASYLDAEKKNAPNGATPPNPSKKKEPPINRKDWNWEHIKQFACDHPNLDVLAKFENPGMVKATGDLSTKWVAFDAIDLLDELERHKINPERYQSLNDYTVKQKIKGEYNIFKRMGWSLSNWLKSEPHITVVIPPSSAPPPTNGEYLVPLSPAQLREKRAREKAESEVKAS